MNHFAKIAAQLAAQDLDAILLTEEMPVSVYTVTGINTDVLITIDGDLMFSGNPNDPASDDGGMPMWMWIMLVVVILLIAATILWMRGRQVDQGRN